MVFIRNSWYAAGWVSEIEYSKPISRTILGEAVVLFRTESGKLTALYDLCPHRFVPLHLGHVKGEVIECAYHGLAFDSSGQCVHNPHGDGKISSKMQVRGYPVEERDGIVWIWMGDPAKADPSIIVPFPMLIAPDWRATFGRMRVEANYKLVNDNLLDLSHAQFVHPIFRQQEPPRRIETTSGVEARTIWSKDRLYDCPIHAFGALFLDAARIDAWRDTYWHAPSIIHLDIGAAPEGADWKSSASFPGVHLLTPETEVSTHYFWAMAWNVHLDDKTLAQRVHQGASGAFMDEDKPIIEMQQRMLGDGDLMSRSPVLLQTDAKSIQARRIIAEMVNAEAEPGSAPELIS